MSWIANEEVSWIANEEVDCNPTMPLTARQRESQRAWLAEEGFVWWRDGVVRCSRCGNIRHPSSIHYLPNWQSNHQFIHRLTIYDPRTGTKISSVDWLDEVQKRPCDLFPALRRAIYYDWKQRQLTDPHRCSVEELQIRLDFDLDPESLGKIARGFVCNSHYSDDFDGMAHVNAINAPHWSLEWMNENCTAHLFYGTGQQNFDRDEYNLCKEFFVRDGTLVTEPAEAIVQYRPVYFHQRTQRKDGKRGRK